MLDVLYLVKLKMMIINLKDYSFIDYSKFEDSVYSIDWLKNDSWTFVTVSFNSYFHINIIHKDIKYKIML